VAGTPLLGSRKGWTGLAGGGASSAACCLCTVAGGRMLLCMRWGSASVLVSLCVLSEQRSVMRACLWLQQQR
jgi:hypothetical protein